GRLRPELRELDRLLLEGRLVLARDEGVADLPVDLVERVTAGDGEVALDAELLGVVGDRVLKLGLGDLRGLYGRHLSLPGSRSSKRGEGHRRGTVGRNHSIGRAGGERGWFAGVFPQVRAAVPAHARWLHRQLAGAVAPFRHAAPRGKLRRSGPH